MKGANTRPSRGVSKAARASAADTETAVEAVEAGVAAPRATSHHANHKSKSIPLDSRVLRPVSKNYCITFSFVKMALLPSFACSGRAWRTFVLPRSGNMNYCSATPVRPPSEPGLVFAQHAQHEAAGPYALANAGLASTAVSSPPRPETVSIPAYLQETYWWAYVHPRAVHFFERQWLVNAILWGNFSRLRDAAMANLSPQGSTLQIACVYGDFTPRLAEHLAPGVAFDVVDVLPVQLRNLREKLPPSSKVRLFHYDSSALGFADASYDQVVLYFLLHEQPAAIRAQTLREALRVTRPGGKIVIVDYHGPSRLHPLRYIFRPVLRLLEPFALDLWDAPLSSWVSEAARASISVDTYFGGLYQKVIIEKPL
jgi:ubiquinone/menaquinone biosynthesis C-methylase UbiE